MLRPDAKRRTRRPETVALTFDDGPDPVYTPQVLEILAAHDAVATFFLVGRRAAEHPQIVRHILDDGHCIGSHTWSHPELAQTRLTRLVGEIGRGRRVLEQVAGTRVVLFRPPKGHLDLRVSVAARLVRVDVWKWSLDAADWHVGRTEAEIGAALAGVGSGDVVLLHDGLEQPLAPEALDRSATVAALAPLLELCRARGLRTIRLDEA
jgi:peptidoglycan/xylan/chitin deacetylase (PgdA/CDA1 family)